MRRDRAQGQFTQANFPLAPALEGHMKDTIVPSYILVTDAANCNGLNHKQSWLLTRSLCLVRKDDTDHPIDKELIKNKSTTSWWL